MEMCYDGALVMPCNYTVMDEEEMSYTDGGAYLNIMTTGVCGAILNTAIGIAVGGVAGGVAGIIKKKGEKEAAKFFARTVASKLKAFGLKKLAGSVGTIASFILNYSDMGGAVASWVDSNDAHPNDSWISVPLPW